MTFHTVTKDGSTIMPEVLQGIIACGASLTVISSNQAVVDKHHHYDMADICACWRRAMMTCDREYFVGMDSDVLLEKNIVDEMLRDFSINKYDLLLCKTGMSAKPKHGFWVARKNILATYPQPTRRCSTCQWIEELGDRVVWFNKNMKEIGKCKLRSQPGHAKK